MCDLTNAIININQPAIDIALRMPLIRGRGELSTNESSSRPFQRLRLATAPKYRHQHSCMYPQKRPYPSLTKLSTFHMCNPRPVGKCRVYR